MAQRRKSAKKKVERWNDAPRRGNPFGLFLILVGAGGLVYAACAPKVKHVTDSAPPPVVAQPSPVVPRARYGTPSAAPARTVEVKEKRRKPRENDDDEPRVKLPERVARQAEPETDTTPTIVQEPAVPPARTSDALIEKSEPHAMEPSPPEPVPEPKPRPAPTPRAPKPAIAPVPSPRPLKPSASGAAISTAEFSRNPAAGGEVALTFDGCYDDRPLADILAALDHHGYRATFFIAGVFADKFPRSVRRISDAGMELGNHSWDHPAFTKLSASEINRQLTRTNDLITQITGQKPDLFRPPFGARDNRVRKQLADEGYHTVYWALDSWDSVKKGITAKEVRDRVLSRVKPGDVVLLHVGSRATADALPEILKGLDSRGLRVVPVSRLMAGR